MLAARSATSSRGAEEYWNHNCLVEAKLLEFSIDSYYKVINCTSTKNVERLVANNFFKRTKAKRPSPSRSMQAGIHTRKVGGRNQGEPLTSPTSPILLIPSGVSATIPQKHRAPHRPNRWRPPELHEDRADNRFDSCSTGAAIPVTLPPHTYGSAL